MKRILAGLLFVILISGCAAKVNVDKETIDKEQSAFRNQGQKVILDIFPKEFLNGIPVEELAGANASLDANGQKCTLSVKWQTNTSLKDTAILIGENLGHELELDVDTWKSSMGDSCASVTSTDEGIEIRHTIAVSRAGNGITILTDDFPYDYFELPEELNLEEVSQKSVSASWAYTLTWLFDITKGEEVTEKLLKFYTKRENYSQELDGDRGCLSYTTNGDDVSIDFWEEEEQVFIQARYQYNEPSHKDSQLMQELIANPQASILQGLPGKYWKIMGESPQSFSLSYIPDENSICYGISVPDDGNLDEILGNAEKAFNGEYISGKEGSYGFETDEYTAIIKCNGDSIGLEINEVPPADFTHPYIHDIYPEQYDPQLPDALQKMPFSMETEYSIGDEYDMVVLRKVWRLEENEAKQAWQELEAALCGKHNFESDTNSEKYGMRCVLIEYSYECNLEKKGEHWIFSVGYRIGV